MKKLFALILALVMMTALTVPALAATKTDLNSEEIPVTGTFVPAGAADVLSIDLSWGDMTFICTEIKTWNTNRYDYDYDYEWAPTSGEGVNKITVDNNSNVSIDVTLDFNATEADGTYIKTAVTHSWTGYTGVKSLGVGSAPLEALLVIDSGVLGTDATTGTEIGNITITLAKTPILS